MILSNVIIPIPVYTNSGPTGPWTESDTKLLIAINVALFILWIVSLTLNALWIRRKGSNQKLRDLLIPMEHHQEWILTAFLSMCLYSTVGLEILGGLIYSVYQLI